MGKGGFLPFSMAAGIHVYLMDPVLAFIVPSSEAIKLSETYSSFTLFLQCLKWQNSLWSWKKWGISRGPPFLQNLSDQEMFLWMGKSSCNLSYSCSLQTFLVIGLGIGVHRAGSCSRGGIPQPWEKPLISVVVEWQRLAVRGHPGMFLCLQNVLLRYEVISREKSNRMRNCIRGRILFKIIVEKMHWNP